MSQDIVIDPWSYYDYKSSFGSGSGPLSSLAPTWVGDNRRRLQAYMLLESYYRNNARWWISDATEAEKAHRREYGDPNTIADQILDSLMGDDQSIVVPDAQKETPDGDAEAQLNKLLEWADQERFSQKNFETEKNAVRLGDGVYVLGWNEELKRPRLWVYDPGFYFPVLEDDEEFPRKIHIAYEFEVLDKSGNKIKKVRRITWELVDVTEDERVEDPSERSHPWNESPTRWTCLMTDATWVLSDLTTKNRENGPDDFSTEKANFKRQNEDLDIDFIPIIHIPNTPAETEHFGTAAIAIVMQLLDDLVSTDTDLQASSATTGTPPIALSGSSAPKDDKGNVRTYGPGTVFETGDGTATMIDTSRSLDALLKYRESQLERLAVNSKVPESLLGRVKPNEVPSGIALTLSFSPHSSLVKRLRLARKTKNPLLLKFVSRFYMKNGDLTKIFKADLIYGSFLPADKQETMTLITQLLVAKAISLETAVRMLVNAGYPIENAVDELVLILTRDFEGANALLDATGDVNAARAYLGMEPLTPEEVSPDLPEEPDEEVL